jgi:hypothetical protein
MDVYFIDSLPKSGQGSYIDFFNRDYDHNGWRRIDIGKIVSLRQEELSESIKKWHTDLCVRGARRFKWWWLLPASRLILWFPPIWKPLALALAVAEVLEGYTEQEIYLVGCPVEVREYLQEFCPKLLIYDGRKIRHVLLHTLLRHLVSFIYIFCVLIYIVTHRGRKLDIEGSSPIIIWTYGLSIGAEQVNIKDHFFGDMFAPGLFKHPVHWVCYDSPLRALATFSYSSVGRSFIYDWIGISEWWSLVKLCFSEGWFHHITIDVTEFVFNGFTSKAFARNFASTLIEGTVPYAEFTAFLGMKRILKELSPKALIYPYEEKCLERALLMAVKECMVTAVTIGFAHAVYNKSLMYLRRRSDAEANPPMPDKLLVTGPALKKWLVDWAGWEPGRILIVGSPRWHNMIGHNTAWVLRGRPLRILILIGPGYEATALSNQMEGFPATFDECEVTIRPYPHSWQAEQDEAYARIKKIRRHIQVSGGPLAEQLSWCDLAVYCSTSAGLEAMLTGRLTVYLDLNHIFKLSPINEKIRDKVLWSCRDLTELKRLLDRVCLMPKPQYVDIVNRQNRSANQIFQKIDYGVLNDLFK